MALQKVLFIADGYGLPPYTFDRSSSAYEINSEGVLALRSSGQLRIDYLDLDNDGVREQPSLVLERASTNKLLHSIEFGSTVWVSTGLTVYSNVLAAPDLSTQADLLVPSTATSFHYVEQASTGLASSTDHAVTVYAIPAGYHYLTVEMRTTDPVSYVAAQFELSSSGAVVQSSGAGGAAALRESHIDRLRPGVYRCMLDGTVNASSDIGVRFLIEQSSSQFRTAWAGSGTSGQLGVALWGAQLEEAVGSETSFMLSSAAAATRAAEQLAIAFPYRPQAMTIYVRFEELSVPVFTAAVGVSSRILQLGNATNNSPRLYLVKISGNDSYQVGHNALGGTYNDVSSAIDLSPTWGDVIELRAVLRADGSVVLGGCKNSGSETVDASPGEDHGLALEWTDELLWLGSLGALGADRIEILDVKVCADEQTMEYMRSVAPFFVIDGVAVPIAVDSVRETPDEMGDRGRTFDGTMRETVRNRPSKWEAETAPLSVGDRNRVRQALQSSTQPVTVYGQMVRTSTGLIPTVFTRLLGETIVQSSTERKYSLRLAAEQSS